MTLEELTLSLPNRPGALAGVARLLAAERINLAAISVDAARGRGRVHLVVNNPSRARELMRRSGYPVETKHLLAVHLEDRAGSFLQVLDVLARARVNIRSVVLLVAREGTRSLVALATDDLDRTREVLKAAGFFSLGAEKIVTNADLLARPPAIPGESVGMLL